MAFAALDLLARVVTPFASHFGGFCRLTVDTAGAGLRVSTGLDANLAAQGIVHACQRPVLAPLAEILVDGLPGRIILGQHPPRTATAEQIENPVDDGAHIRVSMPATARFG